jgi:nucleoside-diphosphate-sugar epimerase
VAALVALDFAQARRRARALGGDLNRARAQRVLIAGCGELGIAIAPLLGDAQVFGLRRDVSRLPASVRPVAADLLSGGGFAHLPAGIDTLIHAPTPGERSESGYRAIYVDALARLQAALPEPASDLRLIYVSSTAVYGQDAGEIVDEASACEPTAFNGRVLLEGERRARERVNDCVALRLSGIYGPGRHWLLRRVRSGETIRAGVHWTNRIHLSDAAALAARLAQLPQVPASVIGVDDQPAPEHEVLDWLAGRLGLPPLPRRDDAPAVSGKRLCNHLSRSLQWRPRYASYRDGYTSVIAGSEPQ